MCQSQLEIFKSLKIQSSYACTAIRMHLNLLLLELNHAELELDHHLIGTLSIGYLNKSYHSNVPNLKG